MGVSRTHHMSRLGARRWSLPMLLGTALVFACDGKGLYDTTAPDVDAPVVEIVEPASGGEVLAGQRLPIRVHATDQEGVSSVTVQASGSVSHTLVFDFVPSRSEVQIDTAIAVPVAAAGSIQLSASSLNTRGVTGTAQSVTLSVSDVNAQPAIIASAVDAAERMEPTDEITVAVTAVDNPGGSGIVDVRNRDIENIQ